MAKCVTSHIQPPDEAEKWVELAKPYNSTYKLSLTVLQTARICAEAQLLFDEKKQNEWWIIGLLKVVKEIIRIDEGYKAWDDSATGVWEYREIRSSSVPNQPPHHIYHGK